MLIYSLTVGPSEADDVVKRVLTVEVNGELVETRNFEPSATSLGEVGVTEGDNVNLALVDVDDAGNVSEPAFVRFVATDTIAPPAPGAFGATLVRETSRQVPVVESEVTPVVEVVVPSPEEVETPVVEVVSPELDLPEPNIDVIPESPPSGYSV